MRSFTLIHTIDADVNTFWRVFLDETYQAAEYARGLGFGYTLLERREEPGKIVRRVHVLPALELPHAIQKLLGERFAYEEDSVFESASRHWFWRNIPAVLAGRMHNEGTMRAEPDGPSRTRRICDVTLDARIPGASARVEDALESNLRHGWDATASFMNQWLRETHGQLAATA